MTCTLGSDEAGRSTLRHLTFASYRSPESATALFTSRCLWLRRASVGAGAHPSVVARRGRAPGHSAHSGPPLTPARDCALHEQMLVASSGVGWRRCPPIRGRPPWSGSWPQCSFRSPAHPSQAVPPTTRHEQAPTLLAFQLQPLVLPQPSQTKQLPAGRIFVPQFMQSGASAVMPMIDSTSSVELCAVGGASCAVSTT